MKRIVKGLFAVVFVIVLLWIGIYIFDESTIPDSVKVLRDSIVNEGFKLCGKDEKCFETFVKNNLKNRCADSNLEKENCLLLKDLVEEKYSFKSTF